MAIASVVIPAHNEANVIDRCLSALLQEAGEDEFEVIVVANGCVDGTAAVAHATAPSAIVLDLSVASKTAALNAGDEVARIFPRIYLDADVELTTRAARDLAAALLDGSVLIARPPAVFDCTSSTSAVRRYHRVKQSLDRGVVAVHGGGVYAIAEAGRARFGKFPDVVADDLYVDWLFTGAERCIVDTEPVRVYAPLDGSALTNQLTRVYRGNRQLRELFPELGISTTPERGRKLISQLRAPARIAMVTNYVWFTSHARLRARRSIDRWERDDSSRQVEQRKIIAGVPFDSPSLEGAVEAIIQLARGNSPQLVTTANVDHVVQLRVNSDLRAAYAASSMTLVDGMPIVWLAKARRIPRIERVAGADLFAPLLKAARDDGLSVMVLGGRSGSFERARDRAAVEVPGLELHGCVPLLGFEKNPELDSEVVRRVADVGPHLLFLCLGTPKQEVWWHRHRPDLPPGVSLGAGASVDFYAGTQRRAPVWMQRAGLEWVFRAALERRLLRRYLGRDLRFLGIAARDLLSPIPSLLTDVDDVRGLS